MDKKKILHTTFASLVISFGLLQVAQASIAVIVNPKSGVKSLTRSEVASIYQGHAVGNFHLNPVDQTAGSKNYTEFYQTLLGWSVDHVQNYWSQLVFTGQANPPPTIGSDAAVVSTIEQDQYAIGYVDGDEVTNGVRVVLTLGGPDHQSKEPQHLKQNIPSRPFRTIKSTHQQDIQNEINQVGQSIEQNQINYQPIQTSQTPDTIKANPEAYQNFMESFNTLNKLIQSSEKTNYFQSAQLTDKNTVTIEATKQWAKAPPRLRSQVTKTLHQLWQNSTGQPNSEVIIK